MRQLLYLSLICTSAALGHLHAAQAIRFEAFAPANMKPSYVATENGQGLNCNYSACALLPGAGFIRKDAGTIEIKVKLDQDLRPYSDYRALVSLPPAPGQKFNNQLSLTFTPEDSKLGFSEGGLVFTIKNGNNSYLVTAKGIDWKAGSTHHIVATWGPGGMRLYLDGQLAGENSYTGGFQSETPSAISVGRHAIGGMPAHLIFDEFKISDIQRDAAYVAAQTKPGTAPQLDANTLVLMHFDGSLVYEGEITEWRAAQSPILAINPRDFNIDSATNNIYAPGEDVAVDVMLFNSRAGNTTPISLTATAKTFRGVEAAKAKIQVTPQDKIGWQSLTVPLPLKDKVGWYSVKVEINEGGKVLSSFETPCLVIPPPAKSRYEFGLDYYGSSLVPWSSMKRLGMTWIRPHNNHWNWHIMELRKGEFDFTRTDADVAGAAANGVKIMAVLGLAPEWAAVRPDNYEAFKGGPNEWKVNSWKYNWRPGNPEEYRNYVTKIVDRYKGKGIYWEHYNEPDWHLPQTIGFAYGGTTEQFVDQMKINAEVIRKLDPKAKIIFPGIACTPMADANFVRDVIKLGGMQYVDIVGMHSYGGNPFFGTQIKLFREAGYKGEIWQTEKLTSRNNMDGTGYQDMYLLQIPDIVETMEMDVPIYIAHPHFDYFKRGVPQIESFVIPFFYRMVGERTYAGRIANFNIHFFDGKEGPLLVVWGKNDTKIQVGTDKVKVTDLFGESTLVDSPNGVLTIKGSPEVHYVTAAPDKPFTLAQVKQPEVSFQPLVNSNFEELDGDAGLGALIPKAWTPSPYHNKGRYAADTKIYKEGKASVRVESPKEDKQTLVQEVTLISGHTYELSGWLRTETSNATPSNRTKATVSIWSRTLSKELASLSEANANSGEFRRYTARFTAPESNPDNAVSLVVYAGTDKAWFDDIELKEIK